MPEQVPPPAVAREVVESVGRHVTEKGELSLGRIMADLGLTKHEVLLALRELEQQGRVTLELPDVPDFPDP